MTDVSDDGGRIERQRPVPGYKEVSIVQTQDTGSFHTISSGLSLPASSFRRLCRLALCTRLHNTAFAWLLQDEHIMMLTVEEEFCQLRVFRRQQLMHHGLSIADNGPFKRESTLNDHIQDAFGLRVARLSHLYVVA